MIDKETLPKIKHPSFRDNRGIYTPISLDSLGESWDQCSIATNEHAFTFRGLHYQTSPSQRKYVKVIQGSIVDFSVSLEDGSVEWAFISDQEAVEIHEGRAHGYLTLVPNTIIAYLVKGEYNPQTEKSIVWSTNEEVARLVRRFATHNPIIISKKDQEGK
jgi:dTDP-4-dehydrorhamnose 3,5-epimerase